MKKIHEVLMIGSLVSALGIPASAFPALFGGGGTSTIALSRVAARIFTPNGDGANDKVTFYLDNPEYAPVSGRIYDLPGGRVANLSLGTDGVSSLQWDGKDDGGRTVSGGVYIYQLDFGGKLVTGTVVVAR